MTNLYSSFQDFFEKYKKELKQLKKKEIKALQTYFEKGGFLRLRYTNSLNIIYPSKEKIKEEVQRLMKEKKTLEQKKRAWENLKKEAQDYIKKVKKKRFFEPIYWQHKIKLIADKNYREEAKKVNIPVELVADEKIKKVLNAFLHNQDYRDNVIATMKNSIVYKNKNFFDSIVDAMDIKKNIAEKKISLIEKSINDLNDLIIAYKVFSRWALAKKK